MIDPKPKRTKKSGAPKKGYKWAETTSGRIPDPKIVPMSKKKAKLIPMRTVSSGTTSSGAPRKTIRNKTRSL